MLKGSIFIPGQTRGTATNDSATAGNVGELITATVVSPGVTLTTATGANVTSISLTAGDWDISATIDFAPAATTSVTQYNSSISLTTATLSPQAGGSGLGTDATTTMNQAAQVPVSNFAQVVPPVRLTIASTTTVFLVAQAVFTVAGLTAFGTIRARRER